MNAKRTVLLIEDDPALLRMVQSMLTQAGYAVIGVKTGAAALEQLAAHDVSLILLDLGLPDMDGKEIIPRSRALSRAPLLVISARGSETEKVAALDLGANDYIAKPFGAAEFLARVRVALRPTPPAAQPEQAQGRKLAIDFGSRRAVMEGGRAVRLSRKEADLVRILAEADGAVVSHEQLVEQLWGADADLMNLRVLAWQVRRKIEPDSAVPRHLIAEAGEGYRLKLD
jgi:two-component system KDP operon response regulator KdpE